MKNVDRLAKYMAANGQNTIMIHTIYGTGSWIIAQKIEEDKWVLSLANPMGNVTHNLGEVSDAQHYKLWIQLTIREVDKKLSQVQRAKELRTEIKNFLKREKTYKKLLKINEPERTNRIKSNSNRNSSKTKIKRCKLLNVV